MYIFKTSLRKIEPMPFFKMKYWIEYYSWVLLIFPFSYNSRPWNAWLPLSKIPIQEILLTQKFLESKTFQSRWWMGKYRIFRRIGFPMCIVNVSFVYCILEKKVIYKPMPVILHQPHPLWHYTIREILLQIMLVFSRIKQIGNNYMPKKFRKGSF